MKRILFIGFMMATVTLLHSQHAFARRILYPEEPLNIKVGVSKLTTITFPKKVAQLVKSGDPESILVENRGYSVFVTPKNIPVAQLIVVTEDGEKYPLNFIYEDTVDDMVSISMQSVCEERQDKNLTIALMKELFIGRVPAGATVINKRKVIHLKDQHLKLVFEKTYELPQSKVYLVTAQNMIKQAVVVPVQQIVYPNLLAIASDREVLFPKGEEGSQTKLYMIVRK